MDLMNPTVAQDASNVLKVKEQISALLKDPVLADVADDVTVADVESLIAVETGAAMSITVKRMDNTELDVILPREVTTAVKDLKAAYESRMNREVHKMMGKRRMSWRYVWKNYCFCIGNVRFTDDKARLLDLGVQSRSVVHLAVHRPRRRYKMR
eukprot:GFYU01011095.1.p1 GENE.GFYU01011095.1~~GFYU01011095.1.p1  ORF type:complete len:154 (-),score=21.56 GFYU01011095.1:144-605(-)